MKSACVFFGGPCMPGLYDDKTDLYDGMTDLYDDMTDLYACP